MRQQVLKALANPPRIFYVPYSLAVINFVVQFVAFIAIYAISLVFFDYDISPVIFLLSVMFVHMVLAIYSRRDPQIGQILSARIQLFKHKVPQRLPA
ncbi:MAG: VirB3 family type IV secretion system protein [Alphaproteobacteria bacterium]|nr:VirB3 family type IV secretion system protein [Alphaproteobacteria bacterium]